MSVGAKIHCPTKNLLYISSYKSDIYIDTNCCIEKRKFLFLLLLIITHGEDYKNVCNKSVRTDLPSRVAEFSIIFNFYFQNYPIHGICFFHTLIIYASDKPTISSINVKETCIIN